MGVKCECTLVTVYTVGIPSTVYVTLPRRAAGARPHYRPSCSTVHVGLTSVGRAKDGVELLGGCRRQPPPATTASANASMARADELGEFGRFGECGGMPHFVFDATGDP